MQDARTNPAPSGRRFLLLVNERALGGHVMAALQRQLEAPLLAGSDLRVAPFVDDTEVHQALASLGPDTIPVAVGGDGTVASVARILRDAGLQHLPMGILPLGTGNGLAHSLGMANPRQAAEALVHGEPIDLDLMTTTHPQAPVSLLSVSVGLEAMAMAAFSTWRSRSRLLGGVLACRHAHRRLSGIHISADGRSVLDAGEPICNAGLYNMPCYGFGVRPRPAADPADGAADLRLHRSRFGYAAYLAAAVGGRTSPLRRHPDWPRVQRATISTPWPVQVDGESLAPASFAVTVVPRGLRLLAPAP